MMLGYENLRLCQRVGYRFILNNDVGAVLADMGLGKTMLAQAGFVALQRTGEVRNMLVVAPIRVVEEVWMQEAEIWSFTKHLRFSLVRGTVAQRKEAVKSKADIYLINFEQLAWLIGWIGRWKNFPFDMLVVDESSLLKSPKTKRFRRIKQVVSRFKRRYIMTGTARPNSALDLWAQYYMLDTGDRLGPNFDRFRRRFFEQTDYNGYTWAPRKGADSRIKRLIEDITLRLDTKHWMKDLPPLVTNIVYVSLPSKVLRNYAKFETELWVALEKGHGVLAPTVAARLIKCHQIANGAVYVEDEDGNRVGWQPVHAMKIDALHEIASESASNLLVVYQYKHDAERIINAFPDAKIFKRNAPNSTTLLNEWNAGKHRMVLLHTRSAGYGLNMQFGGNAIVFFSVMYSLEQHDQVLARIGPTRQKGFADKVIAHYIISRSTIDEAILDTLKHKRKGQHAFMDSLNRYRQS